MVAFTNYFAQAALNDLVGKTAMPSLPANVYVALFSAVGTDAGTGFTEISGGSYARVSTSAASWNAASGTSPATTSNASAVTFPLSTTDWSAGGTTPAIAFGLYDAASGGNLLLWDYLGAFSWLPFTGSSASPSVITAPAHGFSNADPVVVTAEFGGVLPATGGSWAGLLTVANATTDTFTLGVNSTGTGSGSLRKITSQAIPNNVTASFAPGTLTINLG